MADLTPADLARLTLPGTLPGLLRRGSLVRLESGRSGTVLSVSLDTLRAHVFISGLYRERWFELSELALKLTDATSRAHATWSLPGSCVGASWHLSCDDHRCWELHGGETPRDAAWLAWEGIGAEQRRMRLDTVPVYGWDSEDCPALDDLDPEDQRLLPDGSRWVDAEALRRVSLFTAGLEKA